MLTMSKKPADTIQTEKTVLVLSDSQLLFNIIRIGLQQYSLKLFHHEPGANSQEPGPLLQTEEATLDLIILANSSPATEPLVVLAQTGLIRQVGRTPLLIVSNRSFAPCREKLIFHLDFPFTPELLRYTVSAILNRD